MVDLYKDIGGEIIYNSEVAKIDVQQSCTKGLFLKSGKYFKSNIIVLTEILRGHILTFWIKLIARNGVIKKYGIAHFR